jgi:hypothetical protein
MKVQQTTKNKTNLDNTITTTWGLASWTLGLLLLISAANIPMQSIRAIAVATTTGWAYLINKMVGKIYKLNGTPDGAKTEKTGERVKLKQKRKTPVDAWRKKKKKKTTWRFLNWGLKFLFLISVFTTSTLRLTQNSANTQKRLYNLTHDKTILNFPGSAFPIKIATMARNRSKIRASYKSWARQCERIRKWEMKSKENTYKSLRAVSVATTTGWAYLINWVTDRLIYKAYETIMRVVIRKILTNLANETKGMFREMKIALTTDEDIGSSCSH